MKAFKWIILTTVSILACGVRCVTCGNASDHHADKNCDLSFEKTDVSVKTWELNLLASGYQLRTNLGYYKLYTTSLKWGQAWKKCEADGTHLLIINSETEAQAVREIVSSYPSQYAYIIGFHDYFLEGYYVSIHGMRLEDEGYSKWGSGQPDNWKGSEHCGAMRKDGSLADVHCTYSMWFICEHEI
ncbi:hemolymph lipopolysaccharide-binding protein-like [Zootermopsis nevadensis]|nr:hemolymph lipopolysaccharide-binding protein-like [Zootermopsis nevadensis]